MNMSIVNFWGYASYTSNLLQKLFKYKNTENLFYLIVINHLFDAIQNHLEH